MKEEQFFEVKAGAQDKYRASAKDVAGTIEVGGPNVDWNPGFEAEGDIEQIAGCAKKNLGEVQSAPVR